MTPTNPTRSQAERADQTRARILDAALGEFSFNGFAGARTERIAEVASVNKALIYYYFQGKEDLYAAALESVAERISTASMQVLALECSAGERLLRFTLSHFDRIFFQPVFQSLMQQEMIRFRKGESNAMSPLVEKLFRPLGEKMLGVAAEGISSGELIPVESSQVMYATLGPNVFYFLSAPMMRMIGVETDPFAPSVLGLRRRAAIEYLGQSLFVDREYGAAVAARVLSSTPMPEAPSAQSTGVTSTEELFDQQLDEGTGRGGAGPQ
jgi:TetR/AcrR family transcriptional regulator